MVQKIKAILALLFSLGSLWSIICYSEGHPSSSHFSLKKKHVMHHHLQHTHPPLSKIVKYQKKTKVVTVVSKPISIATHPGLMSSIGTRMVEFVHNTISTLRYTAYKLGGTHFDTSNGIYILDCSDYVDHLLQAASPSAYSSLVNSTGSDKPTSEHYYHFFTGLTYKPRHYWNKINSVKELQPGDILVFRNQKNSRTGVEGHVMVVMKKPVRTENSFIVRVTDSASTGHSQDTRSPHTSGIGIGTMQLKINPETGHPSAYAWKLGASWERHVNFAMARPLGH
ncbi:MAG: hypothetical protein K0R24_1789 [Gammaproteobacteria bacterium]|jgi:hypothetical protein|nr:hypothetical protein [Gammaproteobacteria bacterium]MCE3238808.1 hypothetical protein [Gammaproteobacteria bacterium]